MHPCALVHCEQIRSHLREIAGRAPVVLKEYHQRLLQRVRRHARPVVLHGEHDEGTLHLGAHVDARAPRVPVGQLKRMSEEVFEQAVVGETMSAIGAAAGRASGRARIILDTSEIAAFEPGDVLVAPFTDAAWTPLFLIAGAVVVDVGAMNSHAVVVSRELGIPSVLSVTTGTAQLADGMVVTVDGVAGTVTVDSTAGAATV